MKQESLGVETSRDKDKTPESDGIHAFIDGFVESNLKLLEKLRSVQGVLLGKKEIDETERDTRVARLETHIQGIEAQNRLLQSLEQRFESIKGDFKNFHRAAEELLEEI